MKDVMCPVCNTRSVPFWGAFWLIGPFASVRCTACGARLRYSYWGALLLQLLLFIPVVIVFLALVAVPYAGIPLVILFWFGLMWLEVRTRKLKPVKTRREQP